MGANEKLKFYQIIKLKNTGYSDRQVAELVNNLYPSHKNIKKNVSNKLLKIFSVNFKRKTEI